MDELNNSLSFGHRRPDYGFRPSPLSVGGRKVIIEVVEKTNGSDKGSFSTTFDVNHHGQFVADLFTCTRGSFHGEIFFK